MAKFPSGWIFIPRFKDATHIELVERKLVTCQECRYFDDHAMVVHGLEYGDCKSHGLTVVPYWWCADGEANE